MSKRLLARAARSVADQALLRDEFGNTVIVNPVLVAGTNPILVEGRVEYTQAGNPAVEPYKQTWTDQASAQTVGAGTFDFVFPLGDIPIPDESTIRIHCVVTQRLVLVGAGVPESAEWEMLAGWSRRNAGAPVDMRAPSPTIVDTSGTNAGAPPADFTAPSVVIVNTVGTTWVVRIQYSGVLAETIDSSVIVEWQIST